MTVHPVRNTSYGEPAGLWGINCSHQPDPFIPGWSESERKVDNSMVNKRCEARGKQRYEQRMKKKKVGSALPYMLPAMLTHSGRLRQKSSRNKPHCATTASA